MELTYTQIEISKVAEQILNNSASKTFLFYGDMGAGKTTLIKEMVKQIGVSETPSSPSFSIVNEYDTARGPAYHFDFYRIKNTAEAYDIGVEDYFYSGNYIFVEWPEKIAEILPDNSSTITIKKNSNGSRTLNFMPVK